MMSSVKIKHVGQFIECYVNRLHSFQLEVLHYDYFTRATYYACLQFCEWDRFTIRRNVMLSTSCHKRLVYRGNYPHPIKE